MKIPESSSLVEIRRYPIIIIFARNKFPLPKVVEEIFGKCGEIQTLRMSKKSFCHIRYAQVSSLRWLGNMLIEAHTLKQE